MNVEALEYSEGANNMGGVKPVGWFGFVADAVSIPEAPDSEEAADFAAYVTAVGSITMKAGKYMYPMYGELETSGLKGEPQGERGSRSHKRTATWFIPGSAAKNLGAGKAFLNRRMFFVFEEMNDQKRLLGNMKLPAECVASDDLGTKTADAKGMTFEISDYGFGPVPIYTGEIPTEDASGAV